MNIATLAPKVYAELNEIYPSVMAATEYPPAPDNQTTWHNISKFRTDLEEHLKPFRIKVTVAVDKDVPFEAARTPTKGYVWPRIAGYCNWPTKRKPQPGIEIELNHLPSQRRFPMTLIRKTQLRFRIVQVLTHELIHRHQIYKRLQLNTTPPSRIFGLRDVVNAEHESDQKYLGDYDEIEAYAHDTVQELWYYGKVNSTGRSFMKAARDYFHDQDTNVPLIYPLWMYKETFGDDSSHPAVETLFRKIREWEKVAIPIDVS